jgi:hypothetical protein
MNLPKAASVCSRAVILPLAAALLMAGCAPRAAVNAGGGGGGREAAPDDFAPGRFGILEPEVMMYDVSAGGVFEYRDDWSGSASRRAAVSAALKLGALGYESTLLPDAAGGAAEVFRLKTKMRYHAAAFQSPFFSGLNVIAEIDSLTYSVGPVQTLCDAYGVDGLLYIYGFTEKFSEERRAGTADAGSERTFMAAILVERDGRVSWYRHMLADGGLDMRTEAHSMRMIGAMFK